MVLSKKCNLGLQSFVNVFVCTTEPILSTSQQLPKNQLELLKYWKRSFLPMERFGLHVSRKTLPRQQCVCMGQFFFLFLRPQQTCTAVGRPILFACGCGGSRTNDPVTNDHNSIAQTWVKMEQSYKKVERSFRFRDLDIGIYSIIH